MGRITLTVHELDNVTTILDAQVSLTQTQDGLSIPPNLEFGHKVAIRDIRSGEPIIKYGVPIGVATSDISSGMHVHVHNCK